MYREHRIQIGAASQHRALVPFTGDEPQGLLASWEICLTTRYGMNCRQRNRRNNASAAAGQMIARRGAFDHRATTCNTSI